MTAPSKRRRREVVLRADGSEYRIPKPPRADVLWYPRYGWPSVLVRRTHDLDVATALAEERWAAIEDGRPLTTHRVGWWTTYAATRTPANAAEDQHGRVVLACPDTAANASPGIEFRP